jgi:hypothetical protein
MKRLPVTLAALVFLLAACAGTSSSTLPTLPTGVTPSTVASAASDQLCGSSSPTNLSTIAGQLDTVNGSTTDTTAIEANLGTLLTNLQSSTVSDTAKPARDAAVAAVTQLQTSIKDPSTKEAAAKQGATALRALSTAIC